MWKLTIEDSDWKISGPGTLSSTKAELSVLCVLFVWNNYKI